MAGFQFNAGEHKAAGGFDVLPAGWYVAQAIKSEIKPTSKPGGARLNIQYQILNQPAAGRIIFGGYNIKNENPVAVEIAMGELAALSNSVGMPVWQDSEQLHGKPFHLKLKVVIDKTGQYEDKNEPSGYKPISEPVKLVESLAMGAAPAAQGFGAPQPGNSTGGFGNPGVSAPANAGFGTPAASAQSAPAQSTVQTQTPVNTAPNFTAAAGAQPWGQQAAAGAVATTTTEQVVAQAEGLPVQTATAAPGWAQNTVQPGEAVATAQTAQAQAAEQTPPDAIAEAAQADVPPWKRNPQ